MNLSILLQIDYKNKSNWTLGQNKPNSNPISEKPKLMQIVYLQRIMKKNADMGSKKTNPIQTQFTKGQNELRAKKSGHLLFM